MLELAENLCILVFKSLQEFLKATEDLLSKCFLRLSGRCLSPVSSQRQSDGRFELVWISTFFWKNYSPKSFTNYSLISLNLTPTPKPADSTGLVPPLESVEASGRLARALQ